MSTERIATVWVAVLVIGVLLLVLSQFARVIATVPVAPIAGY